MNKKSLYEILGINADAYPSQIKRAYHKQSKSAHPDTGGDAEKFKEINEAYKILSDPEKRKRYDAGEKLEDLIKSGSTEQSEINGCLSVMFLHAVSSCEPSHHDVLHKIRSELASVILQANNHILGEKKKIKKFEEVISRFTSKNKNQFFVELANHQIDGLQISISKAEAQKKIFEKAKQFLENFSYDLPLRIGGGINFFSSISSHAV